MPKETCRDRIGENTLMDLWEFSRKVLHEIRGVAKEFRGVLFNFPTVICNTPIKYDNYLI